MSWSTTVALHLAFVSLIVSAPQASAQGVCPDGKLVKSLQDCGVLSDTAKKKGATTAIGTAKGTAIGNWATSGNEEPAAGKGKEQGTLSAGAKTPKGAQPYLKADPAPGETNNR